MQPFTQQLCMPIDWRGTPQQSSAALYAAISVFVPHNEGARQRAQEHEMARSRAELGEYKIWQIKAQEVALYT